MDDDLWDLIESLLRPWPEKTPRPSRWHETGVFKKLHRILPAGLPVSVPGTTVNRRCRRSGR
ncbi:hypothetical protein [Streptomyces hokutonensis]|uniref:hypothetical protein n=1 Tax=Streptomyces hokutonensis TaxID=1306990 RepID=UPI0036CACD48